MSTSPNPNSYIAIVFTYNGSALSYTEFLNKFYVTLPGGAGVQLGSNQYYGYSADTSKTISLGSSYALKNATSSISELLPTNAIGNQKLLTAFENWVQKQAASPGQKAYANLYLSNYTGGRIYLSDGDLALEKTGEPTPVVPSDQSYNLIYDIFEPYIGAQKGTTKIPGNLVDITDIDWFSFPITLKVWSYDFAQSPSSLTEKNSKGVIDICKGGNGKNIYDALLIPGNNSSPTNQYPNEKLPAQSNGSLLLPNCSVYPLKTIVLSGLILARLPDMVSGVI